MFFKVRNEGSKSIAPLAFLYFESLFIFLFFASNSLQEKHILRKRHEEMPIASLIFSFFLKTCCLSKVQQGQGGKEEAYDIKLTTVLDNQRLQRVLQGKRPESSYFKLEMCDLCIFLELRWHMSFHSLLF